MNWAAIYLREASMDLSAQLGTQPFQQAGHDPHRAVQDDDVVQEIVHDEPGAVRDPLLASLQADEDWASSVERRLHGCDNMPESTGVPEPEKIWLLQFKSHPREFKEALLEGVALRACRDALAAEHRPCILPVSEAKIFIKPEQWEAVMTTLEGHQLRPYHVIVAASYEHLVAECLQNISYRRRPKLKTPDSIGRRLLGFQDVPDVSAASVLAESEAEFGSWSPKRTFLCFSPCLRGLDSVCQSTADHYRATVNPRRYLGL